MKLTQDLIVFDLETTSSTNAEGVQTYDNIIQIGALYLKRIENIKYQITDRFNELVKPTNEIISPFICQLTGITNEMVKDKNHFDVIGPLFVEWALRNGSRKSIRLCAWGTYFDVPILRKHYEKNNINYPFSGTAYDVKTWAALWMMLSGRRTDKLSVESVSRQMNIATEGRFHNALVDAETTAQIALRILDDLDHGVFLETDSMQNTQHLRILKS